MASPTSSSERQARLQLAACYQIFDMLGWTELIFNHISLKVPGTTDRFLLNAYGLTYEEVTPENLVVVDEQGVAQANEVVNPAGFLIHGAIHSARPEMTCVMHTHTTAGMAVACLEQGLVLSDFYSALLHGDVAYHDFEGITDVEDERPRLLASLGTRRALILRNHGLLACGATLPEAFYVLWRLERACQIQLAATAAGRLRLLAEEVGTKSATQTKKFDPQGRQDERIFEALCRQLQRRRPHLKWLGQLAKEPSSPSSVGVHALGGMWPPGT